MRIMKQLLVAGLASLALAAVAQAQTTIYITGSTAFRSATHTAITKRLQNVTFGFVGTTLGSASHAIFEGDVPGTTEHVIVKTSWSGSVGGIQTVSQGFQVNFLVTGSGRSASPGTSGLSAPSGANIDSAVPDIAMADNYQIATPFTTPLLVDKIVGVIDFKWIASKDAPAGLNITPQLAQALFQNGSLPLSLFTGDAAQESTKVYAIGRDPDSGTRVTAFAESGVGVFSEVVQYQPTISGTEVTSHQPWPQSTVNGVTFAVGNGGYSSGGTLRDVMKLGTAALGGFYITYAGVSDANNAIAGGAKEVNFNGVTYSANGVRNGQYTFWGYQHLLYKGTLAGIKRNFADQLANQIETVDSPILLSTMRVRRTQDGGIIRPTF